MFLGTHTPRLDDKGRLALPARFRSELEGGLVICKGQDRCLFVFPTTEFSRFTEALAAAVTDPEVRALIDRFGVRARGENRFPMLPGTIDQAVDSVDVLTHPERCRDAVQLLGSGSLASAGSGLSQARVNVRGARRAGR